MARGAKRRRGERHGWARTMVARPRRDLAAANVRRCGVVQQQQPMSLGEMQQTAVWCVQG